MSERCECNVHTYGRTERCSQESGHDGPCTFVTVMDSVKRYTQSELDAAVLAASPCGVAGHLLGEWVEGNSPSVAFTATYTPLDKQVYTLSHCKACLRENAAVQAALIREVKSLRWVAAQAQRFPTIIAECDKRIAELEAK
jgi:hypothetical protein